MPSSSQPDLHRSQEPTDIELSRLGRRDSELIPPGKLQVTSQLHPFWHTKTGIAVIVLSVLAIIGGIVGGVIGGKKTGGNAPAGVVTVSGGRTFTTHITTTATPKSSSTSETPTAEVTARATARAYPIRREAQPAPYFTSILQPTLIVQPPAATTHPP